jgi:hypothetical protein
VEQERKDMVYEDGMPHKKAIYPAVARNLPYQTVLADIMQAQFGVVFHDPKKVFRRQREHIAASIHKLELECVGTKGKVKAKLTAAINKLKKQRDALVE